MSFLEEAQSQCQDERCADVRSGISRQRNRRKSKEVIRFALQMPIIRK